MLDPQDLQTIAQMVATATAEAMKPFHMMMAEKKEAEEKTSRIEKIKSGEIVAETEEEKEMKVIHDIHQFRLHLIERGKIAPANKEEREIWRKGQGYEYDGKIKN